jgi:hypothetical protein
VARWRRPQRAHATRVLRLEARTAMAPGQSWAYDAQRIAFQLRDGKVVSWLMC